MACFHGRKQAVYRRGQRRGVCLLYIPMGEPLYTRENRASLIALWCGLSAIDHPLFPRLFRARFWSPQATGSKPFINPQVLRHKDLSGKPCFHRKEYFRSYLQRMDMNDDDLIHKNSEHSAVYSRGDVVDRRDSLCTER